jgi:alpha-galactosidase
MSKYVPYFRKNPEMVRHFVKRRWDYYDICVKKKGDLDTEIRDQIEGRKKMRGDRF